MTAACGKAAGGLPAGQQDHELQMCAAKKEILLPKVDIEHKLPRGLFLQLAQPPGQRLCVGSSIF
jgi:hypothetical protein